MRHWQLIEALEARYTAKEATVRTIHGAQPGWRIGTLAGTSRGPLMRQKNYQTACYNVDVPRDQR
ncbi:MAG: hypothetical protein GXY82_06550 [Methanospirillum sp.]|nr:hypothetical protein [Methanospirillum sp.]